MWYSKKNPKTRQAVTRRAKVKSKAEAQRKLKDYKGDAVGKLNQAALEPDRHFFSFYDLDESIDYIHLHVFVDGHPDVTRNLGFRDTLRKSPSLAEEYAQIKHQLKGQGMSRHEYTRTKSTFISRVVSEHGK